MRRIARALLLGATAAASALGCRSTCEPVERQLHARENELLEAREEIERCHAINEGLQMELQAAHADPSANPGDPNCPAPPAYPIRSLTLGRQTGGRDGDASGGDEALQVVVEPLDADNQAVKVPGSLFIQALEITPAGLKQPLSTWQISDDELRRSWRAGLLGAGYFLVLPWKVWPTNDKLRVDVQFHTADGRLFEADKDVTIRVVPAAKRPRRPCRRPPTGRRCRRHASCRRRNPIRRPPTAAPTSIPCRRTQRTRQPGVRAPPRTRRRRRRSCVPSFTRKPSSREPRSPRVEVVEHSEGRAEQGEKNQRDAEHLEHPAEDRLLFDRRRFRQRPP